MLESITQGLMQSASLSLPAALLLGLLVALNPCQLAINMSALTYLHKNSTDSKTSFRKGILYAAGRTMTYTLLGWILTFIFTQGSTITAISNLLSQGEGLLPYILIAAGLFLIIRAFHSHHHHGDSCHNSGYIIRRKGTSGAFVLGTLLAFAFCPESAIFYFGMMLPLASSDTTGWAVPLVFAISATLPVLLLSWLISKAIHTAQRFSNTFANFQQWLNVITGILLIGIASIFLYLSSNNHQHGCHHSAVVIDTTALRNGDLLFRKGNGGESQFVTGISNGIYSHIALAHKTDSGWHAVHAVPGETTLKSDTDFLKSESLELFYCPERAQSGAIAKVRCSDSIAKQALAFVLDKVHRRFAFDHTYRLSDSSEYYCTELIYHAYLTQGIDLADDRRTSFPMPGTDNEFIFPSDILASPYIENIKQL